MSLVGWVAKNERRCGAWVGVDVRRTTGENRGDRDLRNMRDAGQIGTNIVENSQLCLINRV